MSVQAVDFKAFERSIRSSDNTFQWCARKIARVLSRTRSLKRRHNSRPPLPPTWGVVSTLGRSHGGLVEDSASFATHLETAENFSVYRNDGVELNCGSVSPITLTNRNIGKNYAPRLRCAAKLIDRADRQTLNYFALRS